MSRHLDLSILLLGFLVAKVLFLSQGHENTIVPSLYQDISDYIMGLFFLRGPSFITKHELLLPFMNRNHVSCQMLPLKSYPVPMLQLDASPREKDSRDLDVAPRAHSTWKSKTVGLS